MKGLVSFLSLVMLFAGASTLCVRADDVGNALLLSPDALKWSAAGGALAGTQIVVLDGDAKKAGSQYALRRKFPDGFKVPPHFHSGDELVTVLQGTILVGFGDAFDESKMTAMPAGSYFKIPANKHHYVKSMGETVVEVHGVGPQNTTAVAGDGK